MLRWSVGLTAGAMWVAAAGAEPQTVRVGTEPAFAPFEYEDAQTHELAGFDIDLIRAIGEDQQFTVDLKAMNFDALIPALMSGDLDAAIAGITITDERRNMVGFSAPYYKSGLGVMINNSQKDAIKSAADLAHKTVCAQTDTSGSEYAAELDGSTVVQYDTSTETYTELRAGNCDACINDKPVHEYYLAQSGADNLSLLPEMITHEDYGIAYNQDNADLGKLLDAGLSNLKANGKYAEIYRKWFGTDPQ